MLKSCRNPQTLDFKFSTKLLFNPLIGLKHKRNETYKSNILGFPAGFEHVGPQIRIPREKLCI